MADQIHELRVTLADTRPPIWRRVAVPANITLGQLHEVIQIAMGWTDSHLHLFTVLPPAQIKGELGRSIGSINRQLVGGMDVFHDRQTFAPPGGLMGAANETKAVLADVLPDEGCRLEYMYDMGDSWAHIVEVKKIYDAAPGVVYPKCLAGKKACPPDDCGGVWGFYEMLEALAAPGHERHEEVVEWIGEFGVDAFDIDKTNAGLTRCRAAKSHGRSQRSRRKTD